MIGIIKIVLKDSLIGMSVTRTTVMFESFPVELVSIGRIPGRTGLEKSR